ncbi:MAG TPA: rod shape-determining protein RodA [Actinomycetota bacterium]|nr:rod shape-determining protein RodA [Actinomycetota bacterium]
MTDFAEFGSRHYASRDRTSMSSKAPIRHVDGWLILAVMGLTTVGCIAIRSASAAILNVQGLDPDYYLKRQLVFFSLATIVFGVTLLVDYRQLQPYTPFFYAGAVLLLLVVLTPLGETVKGAQRWIGIGVFQLQPAEVMKLGYILFLAAVLSRERTQDGPISGATPVIQALLLAAVPALLIYLQPDLGSSLVVVAVAFAVLLVAGVQVRWLVLVVVAGIAIGGLALKLDVLHQYQIDRLTAFMDSDSDPQRSGFNLEQSKIAIGSGGFGGKGWGQGTQTNLAYVPEQRTDFIFTAIGEEQGFVGGLFILSLFSVVLWRCIRTAMLSKDLFGALVAGGVAAMLGFQLFVNIGMTIGIMPITGIPLPFVSYGGTSLVTSFAGVGLVMNIHMRRFV